MAILTLEETKQFLRIDSTDDDALLGTLITAAGEYLYNATGKTFDSTNSLAKLFCMVLVSDWYDDRSLITTTSNQTRRIIDSMLVQLAFCS